MKKNISDIKKVFEKINAHGPFNHSIWTYNNMEITNEEGLKGRANFISKTIREIIVKNFSTTNLNKMSIADVGCYDGWLLHQLDQLPFYKRVGIEPRQKNIVKGKKIREILNIQTNIKFRKQSISNLGKERFDIVLCIGTLHHVESIPDALRRLDSICKQMLVLETLCLPSKYITKSLNEDMELKDVIYQNKKKISGLTGQKYESSYYDGSASETTIVSIPTIESLIMYLDVLGYDQIKITAKPSDFAKAMKENKRPSQEVLLYATKSKKKKNEDVLKYIKNYEKGMVETIISNPLIMPLYNKYYLKQKVTHTSKLVKTIMKYIDYKQNHISSFEKHFKNKYELEIIKNLKFNTVDKIAFEYAKILYAEKKYEESIKILQNITQKINADWRSVYRSFYLLAKIYQKNGKSKEYQRYEKLCKTCNPNFSLVI